MSNLYTAIQLLPPSAEGRTQAILERNYCRLLRMVNEVSLFSRLNQTDADLPPVALDLAELCRNAVAQIEALGQRFGRKLRFEAESAAMTVLGAEDLLEQLLYHLISNAWRASAEGGEIVLHLRQSGERVLLTVSDQGGGMEGRTLLTAFDPNSGEDALTDTDAGLGLGIPICQRIASLHRGTLALESREGGLSATLSLPLLRRSETPLRQPKRAYDADGGISKPLLELSDVLPAEAFSH
jgi:two-component system CheB/CheR fusion protein